MVSTLIHMQGNTHTSYSTITLVIYSLFSAFSHSLSPSLSDHLKGEAELAEEKLILGEMLAVGEQRDALVSLLEEQRLQESQEDRDLEAIMLSRGLGLHNWA